MQWFEVVQTIWYVNTGKEFTFYFAETFFLTFCRASFCLSDLAFVLLFLYQDPPKKGRKKTFQFCLNITFEKKRQKKTKIVLIFAKAKIVLKKEET